jgi:hypothetical protein
MLNATIKTIILRGCFDEGHYPEFYGVILTNSTDVDKCKKIFSFIKCG